MNAATTVTQKQLGEFLVNVALACPVQVRREHAFHIPAGHSLPFVPQGPVFRIE
jgi:hypothetical protein